HADRVRDRAARAGVDLVEYEGRRRAAIREHDLQGEQKAREFAAGRDLHQRARPGPGVRLYPKLDAVDPVRTRTAGLRRDFREEARAIEPQRLEFGIDCAVESASRPLTGRREGPSGV